MKRMFSLNDACSALAIDKTTLYRWLARARMEAKQDEVDQRKRVLSLSQVQTLARMHDRPLLGMSASIHSEDTSQPHDERLIALEAKIEALEARCPDISLGRIEALESNYRDGNEHLREGYASLAARVEALESQINAIGRYVKENVTLIARVEVLESALASTYELLQTIEAELEQRAPTTPPATATPRPARAEYAMSKDTQVDLPAGLVPFYQFYHGVPTNTAKRLMENAGVNIIRGHWIAEKHHFDKALDAEGQHQAYRALRDHPRFRACERCPHEA